MSNPYAIRIDLSPTGELSAGEPSGRAASISLPAPGTAGHSLDPGPGDTDGGAAPRTSSDQALPQGAADAPVTDGGAPALSAGGNGPAAAGDRNPQSALEAGGAPQAPEGGVQ